VFLLVECGWCHAAFMRAQAALPDWAITDGERKALASKQPLAHSRAAGPAPHTKMKPATAKAPIDKAVNETACRAHTRNHTEAVACCCALLALLGSRQIGALVGATFPYDFRRRTARGCCRLHLMTFSFQS
jgi:hypothetical protein